MKNKTETCLRNAIVMALKTRDSQGHPSEAGEKRKTLGFQAQKNGDGEVMERMINKANIITN